MRRERGTGSSRRAVLQGGLTVLATGLAAHVQAQAPQKLAQKVVQSRPTPKNGQMCSNCVNFEAPNACKLVEGPIAPSGWCIAFGPKNG